MKRLAFLTVTLLLAGCDQTETSGRKLVEASLRDPSSAQFRNLVTVTEPQIAPTAGLVVTPGGKVLCGEVNGKNGFGGYAGFQRFIADISSGRVTLEPAPAPATIGMDPDRQLFAIQWLSACTMPAIGH